MRNLFLCVTGAVAVCLLAGCKTSSPQSFDNKFAPLGGAAEAKPVTLTNALSPELLKASAAPFTLGPGDRLEIEIIGQTNSQAITAVGPDGKLYFHLLPGMDVWGITLDQAREEMEKGLAKYINQPQLVVTLREVGSKYVWVLGRLNRPGIYPITGPMSLLESLALAGGPAHSMAQGTSEELADLKHSFVMREGQPLPVDFYRLLRQGDTSQNIMLQPDDFVYVPSALDQEVYVLGAVRFPRALPYTEQMTLVSAISSGSGHTRLLWGSTDDPGPFFKDAYLSHVAIVRGSLTEPQIAVVDYNKILKGQASDVRLEPGDIVFVPTSPFTNLKRYFNIILSTFVTTVAANEGVRAAGGKIGVGVSVPVGQ
jgi:protein involved in polysaccharide export with SLBB domain